MVNESFQLIQNGLTLAGYVALLVGFSGWAVLFAVPIAAVVMTLFDVVLRDVDPAEEEVPAVIQADGRDVDTAIMEASRG